MRHKGLGFRQRKQAAAQLRHQQRLAAKGRHARLSGFLFNGGPIRFGQRDDGNILSRLLTDAANKLHAAHVGKLPVRHIQPVKILRLDGLAYQAQGLFAGGSQSGPHSHLLKHMRRAFARAGVAVHNQDGAVFQAGNRKGFLRFRIETEGKGNADPSARALSAFHRDRAVHQIHNVFGDGHPQTSALNAAERGIALPLKGLKNAADKFLAHTDAVVLDDKLIIGEALGGAGLFQRRHRDGAAGVGIFDGVAQQVEQHLVEAQLIAANLLVLDARKIHMEGLLLGVNVRLHNAAQPLKNLR